MITVVLNDAINTTYGNGDDSMTVEWCNWHCLTHMITSHPAGRVAGKSWSWLGTSTWPKWGSFQQGLID